MECTIRDPSQDLPDHQGPSEKSHVATVGRSVGCCGRHSIRKGSSPPAERARSFYWQFCTIRVAHLACCASQHSTHSAPSSTGSPPARIRLPGRQPISLLNYANGLTPGGCTVDLSHFHSSRAGGRASPRNARKPLKNRSDDAGREVGTRRLRHASSPVGGRRPATASHCWRFHWLQGASC